MYYTWMNDAISDSALSLPGFQLFREDHNAESARKSCGGGTCFYINERWCTDVTALKKMCCPDLEVLFMNCKPFYLLREFSSFILVSVYIPPKAHVSLALQKLTDQIKNNRTLLLSFSGTLIKQISPLNCQHAYSMLHVPRDIGSLLHHNKGCISLCTMGSFRTLRPLFGSSYTELQAETEIS